jgi:hypothetical protein
MDSVIDTRTLRLCALSMRASASSSPDEVAGTCAVDVPARRGKIRCEIDVRGGAGASTAITMAVVAFASWAGRQSKSARAAGLTRITRMAIRCRAVQETTVRTSCARWGTRPSHADADRLADARASPTTSRAGSARCSRRRGRMTSITSTAFRPSTLRPRRPDGLLRKASTRAGPDLRARLRSIHSARSRR